MASTAVQSLELDLDVFAEPFDPLLPPVLREELDLLEVELAEIVITRNWAIRAIVSEVIVDDIDGGFVVELRGPLVPAGALFRPADPARDAAESANGSARKPSSNPSPPSMTG